MRFCRLIFAFSLMSAGSAMACPEAPPSACQPMLRIIDFNCDGALKISAVGDSIAYGRGDTQHNEGGGYLLRIRSFIRRKGARGEIGNGGVPGVTTDQMIRRLKQEFTRPGLQPMEQTLKNSDVVIVDIGRNDFWQGVSAGTTARNIKRIAKMLQRNLKAQGVPPLVVIAALIPNTRTNLVNEITQREFVARVNAALKMLNQKLYPVAVPFDNMPSGLLQQPPRFDAGLHPTPKGYVYMARVLRKFLRSNGRNMMQAKRLDSDNDDVFDVCETRRFYKTDPFNPDTDGDTIPDGEEIYVLGTDPLVPDVPVP